MVHGLFFYVALATVLSSFHNVRAQKQGGVLPLLKVLEVGSNLQNITVPNYDEQQQPASLFTARNVQVITKHQIRAEEAAYALFSPEGAEKSRLEMKEAYYNEKAGLLTAKKEVTFESKSPQIHAEGTGAYALVEERMAYVEGPISAIMKKSEKKQKGETSQWRGPWVKGLAYFMNPQKEMRNLLMLASLIPSEGISTESVTKAAGIEETAIQITEKELSQLKQDEDMGTAEELDNIHRYAKREEKENERRILEVEKEKGWFAKRIGKPNFFLVATKNENKIKPLVDVPKASDPKADDEVRVTCEGGMFTNTAKGYAVFLKNVEFLDNRATLSCKKELKVFFKQEKPSDKKKETKNKSIALGIGKLQIKDVERVVATGGVSIWMKGKNGAPPIQATAEMVTYYMKTQTIILKGGYPTIYQKGRIGLEAKEPNLIIKWGNDFYASPGKWKTDFTPETK